MQMLDEKWLALISFLFQEDSAYLRVGEDWTDLSKRCRFVWLFCALTKLVKQTSWP